MKCSARIKFDNGAVLPCKMVLTETERAVGLAAAPDLLIGQGLWFTYEADQRPMFWNRGVPYDVELIVIDSDTMAVASISELKAQSQTIFVPTVASRNIVEVKRGTCESLGISIGTRISGVESIGKEGEAGQAP